MIILNFANPDMVGHSGLLEPTIKAIEATDECLGKVVEAILAKGGVAVITADHGNADMVLDAERTSASRRIRRILCRLLSLTNLLH